jgi:RNA recognition motif-containing protein
MKQQTSSATNNRYVVFVGNMSTDLKECDLRVMVEPFGTVQNIDLIKVHALGASCGFAFVEMKDEHSAKRAIAELNGKSIDGRCLNVRLGF